MSKPLKIKYPKFVLFGLMSYGPHLWTFDNAREVVEHLWGQYLPHFALFKNGEHVSLKGGEFEEMIKRLER